MVIQIVDEATGAVLAMGENWAVVPPPGERITLGHVNYMVTDRTWGVTVGQSLFASVDALLTVKREEDCQNFELTPPPSTVGEIRARLAELPDDLPCFFRPKYHGTVQYVDNVPIRRSGISVMHPDRKLYPEAPEQYVCFLC